MLGPAKNAVGSPFELDHFGSGMQPTIIERQCAEPAFPARIRGKREVLDRHNIRRGLQTTEEIGEGGRIKQIAVAVAEASTRKRVEIGRGQSGGVHGMVAVSRIENSVAGQQHSSQRRHIQTQPVRARRHTAPYDPI